MRVFFTDEFKRQNLTFTAPRPGDAGYDLYALEAVDLLRSERALIRTGLHLEIPKGYVGIIKDRSSMAVAGLHTLGGVIDAAYRGELKVLLINLSESDTAIRIGQKIAQLLVVPYFDEALQIVDHLSDLSASDRGAGGFGSTGS